MPTVGCILHPMAYRHYLKSLHWQGTRLLMANAPKSKCAFCGSSKSINIHHLHYKTVGNESSKDLRRLCRECHTLWHAKFGKKYITDEIVGNIRKLFKAGLPRKRAIPFGAQGKKYTEHVLSNKAHTQDPIRQVGVCNTQQDF